MAAPSAAPRTGPARWWRKNERAVAPYLFIAPFYLLFGAFTLFAIVYSFGLSLFRGAGDTELAFTGLGNYARLFGDARYLHALLNTTVFAAASVCLLLPLSLLLALTLISGYVPWVLKGLYRFSFFLPFITSQVVIAIIFSLVLDERFGLLNAFLAFFHIAGPPWLTTTPWTLQSMILINIWMYIGFDALYWMAGLGAIPREYYDASEIDGAGPLARLWYVTLPLLRPVVLFMVIQAIIGSYNWFATSYLLTGGGPSDSTLSLTYYLYQEAFIYSQFGYANAVGYSMVLIVFALSLVQFLLFGGFRTTEV